MPNARVEITYPRYLPWSARAEESKASAKEESKARRERKDRACSRTWYYTLAHATLLSSPPTRYYAL
eukprot:5683463-Pleurochrysis_carterae.AAC.1